MPNDSKATLAPEIESKNENRNGQKNTQSLIDKDATVHRDRTGKKVSRLDQLRAQHAKQKEEELLAKRMKWGKGIIEDEKKEIREMTVYRDNKELNEMQAKESRWDDPTRKWNLKSKQNRELKWPNRFNIAPGSKWDGVDRSNGYEGELSKHLSLKEAKSHSAYKWSSNDM